MSMNVMSTQIYPIYTARWYARNYGRRIYQAADHSKKAHFVFFLFSSGDTDGRKLFRLWVETTMFSSSQIVAVRFKKSSPQSCGVVMDVSKKS